jgi:DNA-binding protein
MYSWKKLGNKKEENMNNNEPIIDVINYNTQEYIFECLSQFNIGHEKITLKAYGGNLTKGIEIARILQKEVGVSIQKIKLDSMEINNSEIPFIEIPLKLESSKLDKKRPRDIENIREDFNQSDFFNYSTYQLLLDWYLKKSGDLTISVRNKNEKAFTVLKINEKEGKKEYYTHDIKHISKELGTGDDEVNNALYRAGLLFPDKWNKIGSRLSKYDDVILGLDTNVFYNCNISRHLLPIISLIEPKEYVHTPNWLLLVVPSTVMYELEEATNVRGNRGKLMHKGRMGFRSIQEIMELSENIDIPGVSLMIHGQTNPVIDMRNNLFEIRKDIHRYARESNGNTYDDPRFKKTSGGDMEIRSQFKKFLSQIDFHKGTYFLTGDKSCSTLAQAEGLRPIYIPHPHRSTRNSGLLPRVTIPGKAGETSQPLSVNVSLGNIIYEMAVSFGEIVISCGDQSPSIKCDNSGRNIGRWMQKQLMIKKKDLRELLQDYRGRFSLSKSSKLLKKINKRFESSEWLTEMDGAFESELKE